MRAKTRHVSCRCDDISPLCASLGPEDPQCGTALRIPGEVARESAMLVWAGFGSVAVSRIKAACRHDLEHTNYAAVLKRSIGEPTFDSTAAVLASGADRHSRRRSSELQQ